MINFKSFLILFWPLFIYCTRLSAGFVNEPEPPANSFSVYSRQKGKLLGYYDRKILFDIEYDTNQEISVTYSTADLLCSTPLTQIYTIFFNDDEPHEIKVKVFLSEEAGVMRSKRAEGGQAILGQIGHPLIKGVSGLYDFNRDFLFEWNGADWKWLEKSMSRETNGTLSAVFSAKLSGSYLNFIFRPRYYGEHLGYKYHKPWIRRPEKRSMNGWCSWLAYHDDINISNITATASFINQNLLPYGLDYLQVDNGYQGKPLMITRFDTPDKCWEKPSDGFPDGFKALAETIKSYGLHPGIWLSPDIYFVEYTDALRDVLCRLPNGKQVHAGWQKNVLDMSDYTVTNYYVPLFKTIKDSGFEYVKVDSLRHVLFDALLRAYKSDEAKRRFRNLCLAARLTFGDDVYLLSCWGVIPEILGSFDACRITIDCNESWVSHHYQLFYFAEMFPLNRVLFLNDPDYITMRVKRDWGRAKVSTISLGGGLFNFSDKPEDIDAERLYTLQRGLPALETRPAESGPLHFNHTSSYVYGKKYNDPMDITEKDAMRQVGPSVESGVPSPFSTFYAFHIDKPFEKWCVALRNALWSLDECYVSLDKLNLENDKLYLAYDYWGKKFLGILKDIVHFDKLEFGETQVIAIREKLSYPQFLASDRHVSMDAVSVEDIVWNDNKLCLKLKLVVGSTTTYSFYVPDGYSLKKAFMEKGKAEVVPGEKGEDGQVVNVLVKAEETSDSLTLAF